MLKFRMFGAKRRPALAETFASKPHPKPGRKWLRRLALLAGALLVFVAFLPNLVGWLGLQDLVARKLSTAIDGKIKVAGLSASWLSSPTLTGVELLDRDGNTVLTAAKIRPSRSLFGLIFGGDDLGEIVIDGATLNLRSDEAGTNLERILAPIINKPKPGNPRPSAHE